MAMVMVVSVRARELAAERVCVLVCESVFLCLSCWWQRLNKNARILYGIISSTCTEHIKPMCIQLDRVCMCVRLRHARILCICGLYVRVYLCVFIWFFIRQRIMLVLLQTLCLFELFMCTFYVYDAVDVDCWLLMLAGDFAAAATATATTENTNTGCVRSKLTQAPKPVLIERREGSERAKKQSRIISI